jgi:hypothetical protein
VKQANLNTTEEEKKILLSKEAKDQTAANLIFRKKFLLSSPGWRPTDVTQIDLDKQVENYANWVKENPDLCLLGNFMRWPEFYEYKINRLMADELRNGGKEVVLAVVKDENGGLKTIQRPIFQREREYLARLSKEVLHK